MSAYNIDSTGQDGIPHFITIQCRNLSWTLKKKKKCFHGEVRNINNFHLKKASYLDLLLITSGVFLSVLIFTSV